MSQAFILCPVSEKYVYVGLNLEWLEVDGLELELGEQEIGCRHCGKSHVWNKDQLVLRSDGGGD
jgi:hypothetical protein